MWQASSENVPDIPYKRQGTHTIDTHVKPGTYQRKDVPGIVRSKGDSVPLCLNLTV